MSQRMTRRVGPRPVAAAFGASHDSTTWTRTGISGSPCSAASSSAWSTTHGGGFSWAGIMYGLTKVNSATSPTNTAPPGIHHQKRKPAPRAP